MTKATKEKESAESKAIQKQIQIACNLESEADQIIAMLRGNKNRFDAGSAYLYKLWISLQQSAAGILGDVVKLTKGSHSRTAEDLSDLFSDEIKKAKRKSSNAVEASQPDLTVVAFDRGQRKRQERIRARYQSMFDRLGGKCSLCGQTNNLEPDHIHGSTWDVAGVSNELRIANYEADEQAGLLRVLCRSCNAKDGAKNKQGKAKYKTNSKKISKSNSSNSNMKSDFKNESDPVQKNFLDGGAGRPRGDSRSTFALNLDDIDEKQA